MGSACRAPMWPGSRDLRLSELSVVCEDGEV